MNTLKPVLLRQPAIEHFINRKSNKEILIPFQVKYRLGQFKDGQESKNSGKTVHSISPGRTITVSKQILIKF